MSDVYPKLTATSQSIECEFNGTIINCYAKLAISSTKYDLITVDIKLPMMESFASGFKRDNELSCDLLPITHHVEHILLRCIDADKLVILGTEDYYHMQFTIDVIKKDSYLLSAILFAITSHMFKSRLPDFSRDTQLNWYTCQLNGNQLKLETIPIVVNHIDCQVINYINNNTIIEQEVFGKWIKIDNIQKLLETSKEKALIMLTNQSIQ